jgi:hypothetical protein
MKGSQQLLTKLRWMGTGFAFLHLFVEEMGGLAHHLKLSVRLWRA